MKKSVTLQNEPLLQQTLHLHCQEIKPQFLQISFDSFIDVDNDELMAWRPQ